MSSRQLEERQEREFHKWIASELGISVDDLNSEDWSLDEIDGNDGAVYGHRVTFSQDTASDFLVEVCGAADQYSVDIGFPPDEYEPDDPDGP
jgi:hypothetical protein